ncbi:hypothetical protein C8A01DRAFT_18512 [Parachaetomium inaequale]|uniref:Uncharacterized protein n=1 Tax=Parachaetomium inaequale TaxID=2588326 RepID=A0AAN6SPF6_9PEZI|nr:hypothetical protein C8A01DRAFT_18512 [Parachaetomium inaequale]
MATDPRPSKMPRCPRWREGDIAFLRHERDFSCQERAELLRGYIPELATNHPVIVLRRLSERSTHVLITTVSAYASERNQGLPPWRQRYHQEKRALDFRSFEGTERVSDHYPPLFLQPGQAMPKPQTSWVHIQSVWAVPITVLKVFTKTRTPLSMRPDSLDELRRHMAAKCRGWRDAQRALAAAERALSGPATHTLAVLAATPHSAAVPVAPSDPAALPVAPAAAATTAPAFPALPGSAGSAVPARSAPAASEATSASEATPAAAPARTGPPARVSYAAALRAPRAPCPTNTVRA